MSGRAGSSENLRCVSILYIGSRERTSNLPNSRVFVVGTPSVDLLQTDFGATSDRRGSVTAGFREILVPISRSVSTEAQPPSASAKTRKDLVSIPIRDRP